MALTGTQAPYNYLNGRMLSLRPPFFRAFLHPQSLKQTQRASLGEVGGPFSSLKRRRWIAPTGQQTEKLFPQRGQRGTMRTPDHEEKEKENLEWRGSKRRGGGGGGGVGGALLPPSEEEVKGEEWRSHEAQRKERSVSFLSFFAEEFPYFFESFSKLKKKKFLTGKLSVKRAFMWERRPAGRSGKRRGPHRGGGSLGCETLFGHLHYFSTEVCVQRSGKFFLRHHPRHICRLRRNFLQFYFNKKVKCTKAKCNKTKIKASKCICQHYKEQ